MGTGLQAGGLSTPPGKRRSGPVVRPIPALRRGLSGGGAGGLVRVYLPVPGPVGIRTVYSM